MEWTRDSFRISDDPSELDVYFITSSLEDTYWAAGRTAEVVQQSIDNSLSFGLYTEGRQIGFARVVTDKCTFAWVCDVIVHPDYRGIGLGKWLMDCLEEHPWVKPVSQQLLRTRDAHGLYERYGYAVCEAMVRKKDKDNPRI